MEWVQGSGCAMQVYDTDLAKVGELKNRALAEIAANKVALGIGCWYTDLRNRHKITATNLL